MKQLTFLLLFLVTSLCLSQTENQSSLTIDQIMQGEDFVGYLPTDIEWSDDSKNIYFSWNPDNDTIRSTYEVNINTKKINKRSFEALKNSSSSGDFSKDFKWKVYEKGGDLFLQNTTDFTSKRITNTLDRESNPKFSGDQKSIIYQQSNNLYQWNIEDGTTKQLTDFKSGKEKPESKLNEQDQWLEDDQFENITILGKRKNESDARKYRREKAQFERPETVYYGDKNLFGLNISPDLNYVVYRLYAAPNNKNTNVPSYVTESGYTTDLNTRPKVGSEQYTYESWIFNVKTGKHYQIKTDDIEGIKDKPKFLKEYAENPSEYKEEYENPREVEISNPMFSEDGKALVNITSSDYKDRWIMTVDLSDGSLKLIDRQHDDAWIGGPGVGWFSSPAMGWLDDETIWFKSEKTGYAHLYSANVNSGKIKALTEGNFEILDVNLSKYKKTFYLISNKVSPHEQHFYHLPTSGGKMTQITSKKGGHEVTVSPDEKQLAIRYSYTNKPWELFVMPNKAGAEMTQLTTSTTKDFESYNWIDSEIINFTARDGASVPATLYKPKTDKKNGAAVIFVHGAGYLQNVHYWWPSYFREYMFHNILVDNGYTVLAIDFRASSGYGRDWRTGIYRHMGGKDLNDQVDGAKYLVEQQGIDKDRLGIYGGSYGGFITLMALFTSPETFKSGAALRSVADWAHYNHGYTANILNTPVEDPKAYEQSSPIYFAEGLKGNLLMLHGMIDTNVHFQDVVRLSQRLIELKKENWELAVFPLEDHSFVESSSWSDEYRRIFKLFQETLRK
ncbi:prolyl oligopeptidase family serine peptidase [Subsaxibacter sp. CAU 1640]|uniref:S9 family peptidase n=1 Tax=Subsaxibacter sp. CAU 1640 TaxID=2933271 RepID=UPI0020051FCD|nr:prolyl oligopeptidase family serine peptidase [Subsaxibacter sp. CAU 1640]MCK7589308.1 prolyl oligopeptidase family serine peptidase [Subsaxibacter sp. CAU 1640]